MNFKEFEELLGGEAKEISLNEDVILESDEDYRRGIELKRDGLVIDGNGHSIDAMERVKAFHIQGDNITIKNLKFKNAVSHKGNGGGAIENVGKGLSIKNSHFFNNRSPGPLGGGAICSFEDMNINDCVFESNTSVESDGGAIYLETFFKPNVTVIIKNCSFKNNYADGGFKDFGSNAGAIFNKNANLYLFDCSFEDNGVVSAYDSSSESIQNKNGIITMDNCCFNTRKSHSIFNLGLLLINSSRFYHDPKEGDILGSIFNRGFVGLLYGERNQYKVELDGKVMDSSDIGDLINEYKKTYNLDTKEFGFLFKKNIIESFNDLSLDNFNLEDFNLGDINLSDYKDDKYLMGLLKNKIDLISSGDFEDSDESI